MCNCTVSTSFLAWKSLKYVKLIGFYIWQICYFFYKNIVFGFTLFFFEMYASFSGQTVYNDWFLSLYNVFFTSLPVIALGVFDQDVSSRYCLKVSSTFLYLFHAIFCLSYIQYQMAYCLLYFCIFSSHFYTKKVSKMCYLVGFEFLDGCSMGYSVLSSYSSFVLGQWTIKLSATAERSSGWKFLVSPCTLVLFGL